MANKIKVNIPGFGYRICSDDVKYKINGNCYIFCKIGTNIIHNEFGPACNDHYGAYEYYINGHLHRENRPARYFPFEDRREYWLHGNFIGTTRKEFNEFLNRYKGNAFNKFDTYDKKITAFIYKLINDYNFSVENINYIIYCIENNKVMFSNNKFNNLAKEMAKKFC